MKRGKSNRFFRSVSLAIALLTGCTGLSNKHEIKPKEQDFLAMGYKQAIEDVKTPEQAVIYVRQLVERARKNNNFDDGNHLYSFKNAHEGSPVDCTEAASAAAALLHDNGFRPYLLSMRGKNDEKGHVLFVYEHKGKLGTIGINKDDNAYGFENIEDIIFYQNDFAFGKANDGIESYCLGDLNEVFGNNYISSNKDLKDLLKK